MGIEYITHLPLMAAYLLVASTVACCGCPQSHLRNFQSANTNLMPAATSRKDSAGNRPTFTVNMPLSSVISCETLTAESWGRLLTRRVTRTLPGAAAMRMFDEIAAHIDVRIEFSLNSLD
jgi:hypothetical protein